MPAQRFAGDRRGGVGLARPRAPIVRGAGVALRIRNSGEDLMRRPYFRCARIERLLDRQRLPGQFARLAQQRGIVSQQVGAVVESLGFAWPIVLRIEYGERLAIPGLDLDVGPALFL
jgi:hypothetical protein